MGRACPSHWPRRFLDWLCAGREDYHAFQQRRLTLVYRASRDRCLLVWAGTAVLLLICGGTVCLLPLGLVATLLCFALLGPE